MADAPSAPKPVNGCASDSDGGLGYRRIPERLEASRRGEPGAG